jgi:hypothetical protein
VTGVTALTGVPALSRRERHDRRARATPARRPDGAHGYPMAGRCAGSVYQG